MDAAGLEAGSLHAKEMLYPMVLPLFIVINLSIYGSKGCLNCMQLFQQLPLPMEGSQVTVYCVLEGSPQSFTATFMTLSSVRKASEIRTSASCKGLSRSLNATLYS